MGRQIASTTRVFVSYSHADDHSLQELAQHFKAFENAGLLKWWSDQSIEKGSDWERHIEAAIDSASVAVLLITPAFMASDYIIRTELPRMLRRRASRQLRIIPIYVTPANVDRLPVAFTDAEGARHSVVLSTIQGFGNPNKDISALTKAERAELLAKIAREVSEAAGTPEIQLQPSTLHRSAATPSATPGHPTSSDNLRTLNISLSLEQRQLVRRYSTPRSAERQAAPVDWDRFEGKVRELQDSLDGVGRRTAAESIHASEIGELLFELLFGTPDDLRSLFRWVANTPDGQPDPRPIAMRVRVRIITSVAQLLLLPWRLTRWNSNLLLDHGWTFEATDLPDTTVSRTTTTPFSIVAVQLSRTANEAQRAQQHFDGMKTMLKRFWPDVEEQGLFRTVHTISQLRNALNGANNELIYFFGRKEVADNQCQLIVGDGVNSESLSLQRLQRMLGELHEPPRVVYLNTEFHGDHRVPWTKLTTPEQLLTGASALIWRRLPSFADDSTLLASDWLRTWADEGQDPLSALHSLHLRYPGSTEASSLLIVTRVREWTTRAATRGVVDAGKIKLQLDRVQQKAQTVHHVREIGSSPVRRVLALVGYGAPSKSKGVAVEHLADQLVARLDSDAAELQVVHKRVQFPQIGSDSLREIELAFSASLGIDPQENLRQLLRRTAPRPTRTGVVRTVLWLNWGVSGINDKPAWTQTQIEQWARFCAETLAPACPEDVRLVAFMAMNLANADEGKTISKQVNALRSKAWSQQAVFQLRVLPQLEAISEDDLVEFLEDPRYSNCPAYLRHEVASLVIARTGGDFDDVVKLLVQGERTHYPALKESLEVQ